MNDNHLELLQLTMILPIYLYGQAVLRETEDIDKDYPELGKLIDNMFETMYHSDGVGLAAPQIGLPISLFVIDGNVLAENFPECKDLKMEIINPDLEIIEDSEIVTREEVAFRSRGSQSRSNVMSTSGSTGSTAIFRSMSRNSRVSPPA